MTQGQAQELFTVCFARLILFLDSKGYKIRLNDVCVESVREGYELVKTADGKYTKVGGLKYYEDAVHMNPGCHYYKTAGDTNIFKYGVWLSIGDEPVWAEAGRFWKSLDDDCAWGGDFGDPNHFSVAFNGKR